ncbi:unnamed protein product [Lampetra planeri]
MSTHRRVRVLASDDKDDEELIPSMADEEGAEALRAEQSAVGACGASPSLEAHVRDAHSHLADLLQAASSILVEMRSLPSLDGKGGIEPTWTRSLLLHGHCTSGAAIVRVTVIGGGTTGGE